MKKYITILLIVIMFSMLFTVAEAVTYQITEPPPFFNCRENFYIFMMDRHHGRTDDKFEYIWDSDAFQNAERMYVPLVKIEDILSIDSKQLDIPRIVVTPRGYSYRIRVTSQDSILGTIGVGVSYRPEFCPEEFPGTKNIINIPLDDIVIQVAISGAYRHGENEMISTIEELREFVFSNPNFSAITPLFSTDNAVREVAKQEFGQNIRNNMLFNEPSLLERFESFIFIIAIGMLLVGIVVLCMILICKRRKKRKIGYENTEDKETE